MKRAFNLWLLVLLITGACVAHADSPNAILRCDPGTVIKKMDGSGKGWYSAGHGRGFADCAIPLTPGSHRLEVCYDASLQGGLYSIEATCAENREVTVDAQSGHTYRLRLHLVRDWKAWIEDVTESEAGLSFEKPPKKPKPTGSKKERETILVMRATPDYAWLQLQTGAIRGKWFNYGNFGPVIPINVTSKGAPDGYHVFRAYAGDTFALTWGQMMIGSILVPKNFAPCGDFPERVYQDIPAGKVLYLGHLSIQDAPGGYVGTYVEDLAEARAYVDAHYPEYAGRLEAAPFREARTGNICRGMGGDLSAVP